MSKKCACKIFPKKSPLRTAPLSASSSSSSSSASAVALMIIFDDRSAATRIVIPSSTKSQRMCGLVILFLIIVNLRWEGAPRSRSRYQQGHPGAGAPPRGGGGGRSGGGGGMMFNGNANGAPAGPRIPAAVAATGSA
ncbi:unnamed protein product [Sphagnum troendelagicum]